MPCYSPEVTIIYRDIESELLKSTTLAPAAKLTGPSQSGTSSKPTPYRCDDCRNYFSVRTGTAFERPRMPLCNWAIAIS